MAKSKKLNLTTSNLINCIIYAVVGVLLLVFRSGSLNILFTILGVVFIALGVYDIIVNKDIVRGVVEAIIGIAILILGWTLATWVLLIFGILLIVKGVLDFVKAFKKGLMAWIVPIVTVVIGILLVISHWALIDVMCIIAGIIFIINAVLALFGASLSK